MRTAMAIRPHPGTIIEQGQVLAVDEEEMLVQTPSATIRAGTAFSCLIQPRAGDQVLVSVDQSGPGYVLAILERPEVAAGQTELVLKGTTNLHVHNGTLHLSADEDVNLAARHSLGLTAPELDVQTRQSRLVTERLQVKARSVSGRFKRLKLVALEVENIFHQLTQRMFEYLRLVRDHEEAQVGSARYLVEDTWTTQSRNQVHMAEEIVKINAGQVHLG